VARNRKRAKERRNRRPAAATRTAPGVATARGQRTEETPEAIEHGTPDVELAEAQLAVGRQAAEQPDRDSEAGEALTESGEGLTEAEFEREEQEELYFEAERAGSEDGEGDGPAEPEAAELAPTGASAPARRVRTHSRLINFLQGSWRELQRVQWPDRRAVMQATGVVIGFVIIAGLYLGLADQVASKIVTLILK
jgi:preprotein translocase subunit SecE